MYQIQKPSYYRADFVGSVLLFAVCWSKYRAMLADMDYPTCDNDVLFALDDIAAELVNDSRSSFYIYG